MTDFTREINRLLLALFAAFGLMLTAAAYYGVVGGALLLDREDNPRLVEAERSVRRGMLVDRDGEILARTVPDANGFSQREYLHPATYSATGYYSYRYGAGGVEAAFDDRLSGALLPETFEQVVLGQPVRGEDVRLTLDLDVQQAAVEAMDGRQGALIVTTVPDGEVLAMVSLPTFDPNTLDDTWDDLIAAPGNPFFNRVLQGRYQPGTVIQIPVLVDAITRGQSLNAQFPSGGVPVQLDDLTLRCVLPPTQSELTLADAFVFGCPAPFSQLAPAIDAKQLEDAFDTYRLSNPPTLEGLIPDGQQSQRPINLSRLNLRDNILGQGTINVSPIAVHAMTSAIINGGNTPQPHIIDAVRAPAADDWTPILPSTPSIPYMTARTADQMRQLMQASAERGTASSAAWGEQTVGGQAAIAYSGEGTVVWFTGYVRLDEQPSIVVTVVLENTDNPADAVEVGRLALLAAQIAILTDTSAAAP